MRLIIVFIVIILLILYYQYKKLEQTSDDEIAFNISNSKDIETKLSGILLDRMSKIDTMTPHEWIEMNNNDMFIKLGKHTYYVFVFENSGDRNFIAKVHPKYKNLSWSDIVKETQQQFISNKYVCDPDLIYNMFNAGTKNEINTIEYYWPDPLTGRLMKKKSLFLSDVSNKITIGIGYNIQDMMKDNKSVYFNHISSIHLLIVGIVCMLIAISMVYLRSKTTHAYKRLTIFIGITLIYCVYYFTSSETLSSLTGEQTKLDMINSGMLSASFLVGVNIFIISTLEKNENHTEDNKEVSIIFALSLLLLLCAIFKITNYSNVNELITARVSNQFIFNYSVILNIIILSNYIVYILTK